MLPMLTFSGSFFNLSAFTGSRSTRKHHGGLIVRKLKGGGIALRRALNRWNRFGHYSAPVSCQMGDIGLLGAPIVSTTVSAERLVPLIVPKLFSDK